MKTKKYTSIKHKLRNVLIDNKKESTENKIKKMDKIINEFNSLKDKEKMGIIKSLQKRIPKNWTIEDYYGSYSTPIINWISFTYPQKFYGRALIDWGIDLQLKSDQNEKCYTLECRTI